LGLPAVAPQNGDRVRGSVFGTNRNDRSAGFYRAMVTPGLVFGKTQGNKGPEITARGCACCAAQDDAGQDAAREHGPDSGDESTDQGARAGADVPSRGGACDGPLCRVFLTFFGSRSRLGHASAWCQNANLIVPKSRMPEVVDSTLGLASIIEDRRDQ